MDDQYNTKRSHGDSKVKPWVDSSSRKEAWEIIKFTLPLLITFMTAIGMRVVDAWFLGGLGPRVMAAVSLGGLFSTIGGIALGNGLLTAIDTLVAQAFTAASHPRTLGVILQRGLIIMAVVSVPIIALWTYGESILVAMGQDPELAHLAQTYLYVSIPTLYPIFVSTALRKFLQSLGEMNITMYMAFTLFPINVLSNYLFLRYWNLGILGASLHIACFHIMVLIIYSVAVWKGTDFSSYWPGWTRHAWTNWGAFLKLGIPGMLSVSTDWAFEVCAIITGVLGQTSLAAQSIVLTVNSFLLTVPTALANALAVRLGHHLGANRPQQARRCVAMSVIMGLIAVSINACLIYGLRYQIADYFTTDVDVRVAIVDLFTVASLCHFSVGNSTVLSGTLNAFGKQSIVAALNLTSYYAVGLPFGLWMTFSYEMGLLGIWSGVAVAGFIKSFGEAYVIMFHIDWEHECRKTVRRISAQETLPSLPK